MKPRPLRTAVLISGTGTNLKALIDAREQGRLDLDLVRVISNRAEAGGLAHARAAGIPCSLIAAAQRDAQDAAVAQCLRESNADLVVLAGYMRVLGAGLVSEFADRLINLHPSLLPKYRGLHTYRRVLEAGDTEHGASVHFVTTELDGGPVIAQARIPVLDGDTEISLAARLAPMEHRLVVAVVELFTYRRVQLRHGRILLDDTHLTRPLHLGADGKLEDNP